MLCQRLSSPPSGLDPQRQVHHGIQQVKSSTFIWLCFRTFLCFTSSVSYLSSQASKRSRWNVMVFCVLQTQDDSWWHTSYKKHGDKGRRSVRLPGQQQGWNRYDVLHPDLHWWAAHVSIHPLTKPLYPWTVTGSWIQSHLTSREKLITPWSGHQSAAHTNIDTGNCSSSHSHLQAILLSESFGPWERSVPAVTKGASICSLYPADVLSVQQSSFTRIPCGDSRFEWSSHRHRRNHSDGLFSVRNPTAWDLVVQR